MCKRSGREDFTGCFLEGHENSYIKTSLTYSRYTVMKTIFCFQISMRSDKIDYTGCFCANKLWKNTCGGKSLFFKIQGTDFFSVMNEVRLKTKLTRFFYNLAPEYKKSLYEVCSLTPFQICMRLDRKRLYRVLLC